MKEGQSCGSCRFVEEQEDVGPMVTRRTCRRYPPQCMPHYFGRGMVLGGGATWPPVSNSDWCGEYAPK